MPKAKPLPADPVERERVLRRRKTVVRAVANWRKAHPGKIRVLRRHWKAAERMRVKAKAAARLADTL